MNKLWLIVRREYLAKVRNKSFIVMTVLSPLLMVGMIVLVVFLTQMNNDGKRVVVVLDDSELFEQQFLSDEQLSFVDFEDISLEEARDSVLSLGYYGLLYIPEGLDLDQVASEITFFSREAPSIAVLAPVEKRIERRLQNGRLTRAGLSPREIDMIDTPYELKTANFSGERSLKGLNEFKAAIGAGFGYLIMMFIIIYGAFVMRSVIEEKTSRIIEVIISSVKPFQLMLGKIIGTSLAGITQFAIWIFSAVLLSLLMFSVLGIDTASLGANAELGLQNAPVIPQAAVTPQSDYTMYAREFMKIPWLLLVSSFLIYFTLGYLIYSSIYAAIGAAVDNETDTQQFMLPVVMPLMLAIYVGFFSVFENPHGPIAVGFSLFPLTSPIVMMMRLPGGVGPDGVPVWQLAVSVVLLIGTFLAIVYLAARIYRVGILMYGIKPGYKEIWRWLKYS